VTAPTTVLTLASGTLELRPGRPVLMGVVNASPESFSDGWVHRDLDDRVAAGLAQVEAGAALVDVGGESGVTDRQPISVDEELRRVVPLVERLVGEGVVVSVDTWKPPVARAVLDAGAAMINDVSGLADAGVARACAAAGAGLVVMHTRAAPKHKEFPRYDDVVADVVGFLAERMGVAAEHGVGPDQMVVDPGPDFAKTPAETVAVLRALPELHALGRPVLLAVSRKDFVGALTGRRPRRRLAGTLAAIGAGVDAGASMLRVHDVAAVTDFLRVRAALRGELDVPADLHLPEALRRERRAHPQAQRHPAPEGSP
jgi:dihydropteroate synthase